jgi:hypothetical protein
MNKHLLISCDLSIQYRNLVGSGLLNYLSNSFSSITLVYNHYVIKETGILPSNVKLVQLNKYSFQKIRTIIYRAAHLYKAKSEPNKRLVHERIIKGYGGIRHISIVSTLFGKYCKKLLLLLVKVDIQLNSRKFKKLGKFDLYFSTSFLWQSYDVLLGLYAQKVGKPWIVQVTSWDNPSVKGDFIFIPDRVIVWGTQNYQEAIKYMKLRKERLVIIPPPHFNIIKNLNKKSIGPNQRKYIYYLGVTKSNYHWESELLSLLLSYIEKYNDLKDIFILFRPHPNDRNIWWNEFLSHPNFKLDYEVTNRTSNHTVFNLDFTSLSNFYENIRKSICVITYKSTTTLESGLLKKPVLMPYFVPGKERPKEMPQDKYPHLDNILRNMPKAYFLRSEEQLLEMIYNCKNGKISNEIINNFYNTCRDIADIEKNIFQNYAEVLKNECK